MIKGYQPSLPFVGGIKPDAARMDVNTSSGESAMSNDVMKAFEFEGSKVRSVIIDGKPWLVASDVARLLGYKDPYGAVAKHCKHAKRLDSREFELLAKSTSNSNGGNPNATFINRSDVMRLCCNSHLEQAQKIEGWLFDDVFVSIMDTGSYVAPGVAAPQPTLALPSKANDLITELVTVIQDSEREKAGAELNAVETALHQLEERSRAERLVNAEAVHKAGTLLIATASRMKDGDGLDDNLPPEWSGTHTLERPLPLIDVMLGLGFKAEREAMAWLRRCKLIDIQRRESSRAEGGGREMEYDEVQIPSLLARSKQWLTGDGGDITVSKRGRGMLEARLGYHRHDYDLRGPVEVSRIRGIVTGHLHGGHIEELRAAFREARTPRNAGFSGPTVRALAAGQ